MMKSHYEFIPMNSPRQFIRLALFAAVIQLIATHSVAASERSPKSSTTLLEQSAEAYFAAHNARHLSACEMRVIDAVVNSETAQCNGTGTAAGVHPGQDMPSFAPPLATLSSPLSPGDATISHTFFQWIQNDPTANQILREHDPTTISVSGAYIDFSLKHFQSSYRFNFAHSSFTMVIFDHTTLSDITFDSCSINLLLATATTIHSMKLNNSNVGTIDFTTCVSDFVISIDYCKINSVSFSTQGVYGALAFSNDTIGTLELFESRFDRLQILFCQITGNVPGLAGTIGHTLAVNVKGIHVANDIFIAGTTLNRIALKDSIIEREFTLRQSTILSDGSSIVGLTDTVPTAISASGLQVGQGLLLEKLTVDGDVNFSEAIVGWSFEVKDSSLQASNSSKSANEVRISATHLQVGRDLLIQRTKLTGAAVFNGAQVGRSFRAEDSSFESSGKSTPSGFFAKKATVKEDFFWNAHLDRGSQLDLSNASVGSFEEVNTNRPAPGHLFIQGFTFDQIRVAGTDPNYFVSWLALSGSPLVDRGAYDRVAKSYEDNGQHLDAAKVQVAKFDEILKKDPLSFWKRIIGWNLGALVGFGYQPFRALSYILYLLMFGWVLFAWGYQNHIIVPTEKAAFLDFEKEYKTPVNYRPFNAFLYSLETLTPFLSFKQADNWFPAASSGNPRRAKVLRGYLWFHMICGWMIVTMFIISLAPDGAARLNGFWS
jgi:hypothetical protein